MEAQISTILHGKVPLPVWVQTAKAPLAVCNIIMVIEFKRHGYTFKNMNIALKNKYYVHRFNYAEFP